MVSGDPAGVQRAVDGAIRAAANAVAGVRLLNMEPKVRQIVDDWCPPNASPDVVDRWFQGVEALLTDRAKLLRARSLSSWPEAWPATALIVDDLASLSPASRNVDRLAAFTRIMKYGRIMGVYAVFTGLDDRWRVLAPWCVKVVADSRTQFRVGGESTPVVVNCDPTG